MSEWISVKDRLPERDGRYIVFTDRNCVTTARFYVPMTFHDGYCRKGGWQYNRKVTHWMPLPEPPEEGTP